MKTRKSVSSFDSLKVISLCAKAPLHSRMEIKIENMPNIIECASTSFQILRNLFLPEESVSESEIDMSSFRNSSLIS